MKPKSLVKLCIWGLWLFATAPLVAQENIQRANQTNSEALQPGCDIEIPFPEADLPPTLYSMMNRTSVPPCLTFCLPDDYSPARTYPLVVYIPGNDGNAKGNISKAKTLAGSNGWVAATLPLFKKSVDRTEIKNGVLVGFEDYPVLAKAYSTMLNGLFVRVPNIDPEKSGLVGFSNGAITIGVLVSNHDEFILSHFRNFCLVDHGMFHLVDLQKSRTRNSRFLLLVGDREEFGRELKNRQGQLQQDAWSLLRVNISCRILQNTGHEFNRPQMEVAREWLRN